MADRHWKAVEAYVEENGRFEPHALRAATGVDADHANAIAFVLAGAGRATLLLQVFHCEDHPAAERPFELGFIDEWPWRCPECGTEVGGPDEVTYGLLCELIEEGREG